MRFLDPSTCVKKKKKKKKKLGDHTHAFNLSSSEELASWLRCFKLSEPQRKENYRGGHAWHPLLASICVPHICAHTKKDSTMGRPGIGQVPGAHKERRVLMCQAFGGIALQG